MSDLYIQKRLPRNPEEAHALQRFHQMEKQRPNHGGRIKPSHVKVYSRLRVNLIKSGLIAPCGQESARDLARKAWENMSWWTKLQLRIKYYKMRLVRFLTKHR